MSQIQEANEINEEPASFIPDIAINFISILNNLQYFAESITKIDNVSERYVLLNQFSEDETHLRNYKFQLEQGYKDVALNEILIGIENCLNYVFQTIF